MSVIKVANVMVRAQVLILRAEAQEDNLDSTLSCDLRGQFSPVVSYSDRGPLAASFPHALQVSIKSPHGEDMKNAADTIRRDPVRLSANPVLQRSPKGTQRIRARMERDL